MSKKKHGRCTYGGRKFSLGGGKDMPAGTSYLDALDRGFCPICAGRLSHKFVRARDVQINLCTELIPGQLWAKNRQ
jgi:hypothetical protein